MITGATSGIGLACARKFAANGDRLIITGRKENVLADIRKELTATGCEVLTLAFDVRDREKAKQYVGSLPEEWRKIDVLVNNAGLALGLEPVYKGIKPLTGDDIADVAVFAANAPAHVQIAEVLILATHQGSGSVIVRE